MHLNVEDKAHEVTILKVGKIDRLSFLDLHFQSGPSMVTWGHIKEREGPAGL